MLLIKLIAISLVMSSIDAWNILVLAPFPIYTRWLYIETFIDNLLANGNSVTVISPYDYSKVNEKYYSLIVPEFPIDDYYSAKEIFTGKFDSDITHLRTLYKIGLMVSELVLNDTSIRKFIRTKSQKYDLVLADHMLQDSLFVFAKKFNCPLMTLGVDGYVGTMDEAMGISTPFTLVPHTISKYDYKMTFMQRSYNALLYMYEAAVRKFSYLPAQNKLVRKFFKESFPDGQIPDVSDVKISAILVNAHRDQNVRPKKVTQVDIAGAHITKPNRAIPQELQEIYEISHDVIYFSLGSYQTSQMPQEKKDAIIEALRDVNKLVFFQIDEDIQVPSNIKTSPWFPQNDILGKSKLKLFITNGGTLSYQEAVKNRVPMIIIPFTGEQYRNGLRAEKDKIGKMILFDDLDAPLLKQTIEFIFSNGGTYYQTSKDAAEAFNSNPIEPMAEAMYWIEKVIKNQGAESLDASHLNFIQLCGLDVIAFYFAIISSSILFWGFSIYLVVRRYREKQHRGKFKYY